MSPPVRMCAPGSMLHRLLDAAVAADTSVVTVRDTDPAKGEDEADGAGRMWFQSGTMHYQPYPFTPDQVIRETVLTPPPGLDEAERMLHALRAEVTPEMRMDVDARLSDGYSRWSLLYTRTGVLVAHRREEYY